MKAVASTLLPLSKNNPLEENDDEGHANDDRSENIRLWFQRVLAAGQNLRGSKCLGSGCLQAVMKEKDQPQGGRLDLLLKNSDDDSMYEVELQLGATDESHIIRTIEYWDKAKKWPKRSHTAVLVAEQITSRFFNVVHLLSMAVPIIGIQANIVQVG